MPTQSEQRSERVFRLLYVEDNPGDVLVVQEALQTLQFKIVLTVMDDGEKALAYLRKEVPYVNERSPNLVLLDLNLPRVSGEEVLKVVKADAQLKSIPVVVFTSAATEELCRPIYRENANSCILKPGNLHGFLDTVQQTCSYWFTVANVPEV